MPDTIVRDPFVGWEQVLKDSDQARPWFGSNPAPIFLSFAVSSDSSGDGYALDVNPQDRGLPPGTPANPCEGL